MVSFLITFSSFSFAVQFLWGPSFSFASRSSRHSPNPQKSKSFTSRCFLSRPWLWMRELWTLSLSRSAESRIISIHWVKSCSVLLSCSMWATLIRVHGWLGQNDVAAPSRPPALPHTFIVCFAKDFPLQTFTFQNASSLRRFAFLRPLATSFSCATCATLVKSHSLKRPSNDQRSDSTIKRSWATEAAFPAISTAKVVFASATTWAVCQRVLSFLAWSASRRSWLPAVNSKHFWVVKGVELDTEQQTGLLQRQQFILPTCTSVCSICTRWSQWTSSLLQVIFTSSSFYWFPVISRRSPCKPSKDLKHFSCSACHKLSNDPHYHYMSEPMCSFVILHQQKTCLKVLVLWQHFLQLLTKSCQQCAATLLKLSKTKTIQNC